jgi:hypothetical protein
VNKKHYAREDEKKREHEAEQNRMFMEQLNAQNAQFAESNGKLFDMVGNSQQHSNAIFAEAMGQPVQVQDSHGGKCGTGDFTIQAYRPENGGSNDMMGSRTDGYRSDTGNSGGGFGMAGMAAQAMTLAPVAGGGVAGLAMMSAMTSQNGSSTSAPAGGKSGIEEPGCAKPAGPASGFKGLSELGDILRGRQGGVDALASKIDTLIDLLKEVLGKRNEGADKAGEKPNDADKAIADANKHYDNAGKGNSSDGLGDKISDLKKLIQELIDKGIISQSEGEKLMQALDKGQANEVAKALEGGGNNGGGAPQAQGGGAPAQGGGAPQAQSGGAPPAQGAGSPPAQGSGQANPAQGSQQSFGSQVDALGPQLEKLSQLTGQANDVKGEIDQRVKAGELSMDAGNTAKADIDRGLEDAKRAVLQMGDSNDVHGTKISDDQILGSVGDKLGAMDKNLDKLAASDVKADAARDRLTTQGNNGTIPQEEAARGIAAVNEKQTATELAVLKW